MSKIQKRKNLRQVHRRGLGRQRERSKLIEFSIILVKIQTSLLLKRVINNLFSIFLTFLVRIHRPT